MLIVKKYGGSSVSTPEKILEIAKRLKSLRDQGHKLIVIVSAMGDTTDELVALSRRITQLPIQREMDMLLSAGERISMALMSMALNSLGCDAISFTGSQSGVFTDGSHNSARIVNLSPTRVQEELEKNRVVIIAGFQGVNPKTKDVTTLGRGGSDTTAVAMAAYFKADRCDILTDVKGIYSVDPRIPGVKPHAFAKLDYSHTLEMAFHGARVLHYRSVELAARAGVPLLVHLSSEEGEGTLISKMENIEIKAVNFDDQIARITFARPCDLNQALSLLNEGMEIKRMPLPQIICERASLEGGREIYVSAPEENFESMEEGLNAACKSQKKEKPTVERGLATVTLTGYGFVNSAAAQKAALILEKEKIFADALVLTPLSLSFVISKNQVQKAVQKLHQELVENEK